MRRPRRNFWRSFRVKTIQITTQVSRVHFFGCARCAHRKFARTCFDKCHVPEELYTYPIGKARTVRKGKDITLVGISAMTWVCTEAADILAKDGIEAEVIDVLSVSPLDYDHILESVRKTEHLVIVDEDNPRCSVATDIAATVADEAIDYLDAPIKRVTAPHTPVPYNPNLEQAYIPNANRVLAAAKLVLDLK